MMRRLRILLRDIFTSTKLSRHEAFMLLARQALTETRKETTCQN